MPKYSIIVIGKEEDKYILPLLKELNKLNEAYEIIFVFPKGDPTWNVIKKHMKRSYKTAYDPGKGPGPARNIGAELAEGEYLLFFDADCWVKAKDIPKLFRLIERREDLAYIYPILDHKPKFFPKYINRFGNILFGHIMFFPLYILYNNILNVPVTLTNVFVCRKSEFVKFDAVYPGEDMLWGYKLKKKTGKKFKFTYVVRSFTYDRRLLNSRLPRYLRILSVLHTLFLYALHTHYFALFKKPLPLLKYRWIR